ncbi:MAG: iron ABC transporter permease [Nocardioides alkalitolerans]
MSATGPMRAAPAHVRTLMVALLVVLAIAIVLPVVAIVGEAFGAESGVGTALGDLVGQPGFWSVIVRNTVVLTVCSTVLSVGIGFMLAVAASMLPAGRRMRTLLRFIPLTPLCVPALVGALGWIFLASPRTGWLNQAIRAVTGSDAEEGPLDIFSMPGAIFVVTLYIVPFVFTILDASMRRLNSEVLEAMRVSGSGPTMMLVRTATGILRPALLAAGTIALVQTISFFSVPLLLRVDVLTTMIYRQVNDLSRPDVAAVASLPLILMAGVLTAGQLFLASAAARYATMTGKGKAGQTVSLGRRADAVLKSLAVGYLGLTALLPVAAIVMVSLLPYWTSGFEWSQVGLDNFRNVLALPGTQAGLRTSATLGLLCGGGAVVIGLLVVVFAERTKGALGRLLYVVANLPLGIPQVVLALGFLVAFIGPPFSLYGTMTLLVLAYLVAFLPLGIRNMGPVVQQVGKELEEAALVSGSTWTGSVARVTLPLVTPAIAASAFLLFLMIFGDLTISAFVSAPGTEVIALRLLDSYTQGTVTVSATIAVLIAAVSLVGVVVAMWASDRVQLSGSPKQTRKPGLSPTAPRPTQQGAPR